MTAYKQPFYYEIAFSFFDVKKQADLIERFVKKYGRRKVTAVLDIACGPSLQLREFAERGYECVGLDRSQAMLDYLRAKDRRIKTINRDLARFRLREKADLAIIMMGSLMVESNEDLLCHLDSVATSLKTGGLYLIENARLDWTDFFESEAAHWLTERGGVKVEAKYDTTFINTYAAALGDHSVVP